MQEHILRQGEEWGGQGSSKFLPNKKHVVPEYSTDPQYKQIFDSQGKKHYTPNASGEGQWKPSVKQIDFDSNHENKRLSAKGIVNKCK
jgi:hypothetical protein